MNNRMALRSNRTVVRARTRRGARRKWVREAGAWDERECASCRERERIRLRCVWRCLTLLGMHRLLVLVLRLLRHMLLGVWLRVGWHRRRADARDRRTQATHVAIHARTRVHRAIHKELVGEPSCSRRAAKRLCLESITDASTLFLKSGVEPIRTILESVARLSTLDVAS